MEDGLDDEFNCSCTEEVYLRLLRSLTGKKLAQCDSQALRFHGFMIKQEYSWRCLGHCAS